jgi:hypothetical protein
MCPWSSVKAKVFRIEKEMVHLEIEDELRFQSEYDFVGSGERPVQGGVVWLRVDTRFDKLIVLTVRLCSQSLSEVEGSEVEGQV